MNKPVLVVLAAGMGSRYGGMKQIDPLGPNGQIIIDYSIYDAKRAGFETVVFVIKRETEQVFKEAIGDKLSKFMNVEYAFQELTDIPDGFEIPKDRVKPWGTAHAVLSARNIIDGPFAVINADDYYGTEAFKLMFDYLSENCEDQSKYALAGYRIKNTVTENGSVSRGVCEIDENDNLTDVIERKNIEQRADGIAFSEDDGKTWEPLSPETVVSMNLIGFTKKFLDEAYAFFPEFLNEYVPKDPMKAEYFLPLIMSKMLSEEKATMKVLYSNDKWYGVTYKEDKPSVMKALNDMTESGLYPEVLWK